MPRNEARTYRHIEVVPASGSLGAEIRGVNVAAALDACVIAEIRQALIAVNTSTKADASKTREDRLRAAGIEMKVLTSEHPAVRTHPETGRKALYVNHGHTAHFKGWTEEESRPLLEYLFAHQVRPELCCRFRWEPGSIAFWDNRCA